MTVDYNFYDRENPYTGDWFFERVPFEAGENGDTTDFAAVEEYAQEMANRRQSTIEFYEAGEPSDKMYAYPKPNETKA